MIFSVNANVSDYLWYVIDSKEARCKLGDDTVFHLDRQPKAYTEVWQPIEVEFFKATEGKGKVIPDITVRNGKLFFNQKAYDLLHDKLKDCGEFLPVSFNKIQGYIFNILVVAESNNAVDLSLSSKNEWGEINSIVFYEDKLENYPVFRTEYDDYMGVYCKEDFKALIESKGLLGVLFNQKLNGAPP